MMELSKQSIQSYIEEDIGSGDLTARLIPEGTEAIANVTTREPMMLCGQQWFNQVFEYINEEVRINWFFQEGDWVEPGSILCLIEGPARALLSGERTALNLLQTLSATATISKQFSDAVLGTGCRILDTRKTVPGLRLAQKYAVKVGGCTNHRIGLFDAVLIKENHILAAGGIKQAINQARSLYSDVMVEIEVETLKEFHEALAEGPDRIMLDNFTLDDMRAAVQINDGQTELEASGNVSLETVREIAETGVDFISVGSLTKNINAIDLSMRIQLAH